MAAQTTDRRAYLLTGRVQGVGFRWWTRQVAVRLGLKGTVRNLFDGRVEVVAAGDPASLAEFRELLTTGPSGARVREIVEIPAPAIQSDDFSITR